MKPVSVGVEVSQPVEQVFDFLDVMANHEPFTNHFLQDFEYSGPDRGVGSKARVRTALGGRSDVIDIEVVDAARPTLIREQNVGAGGKRVGNGTYMLAPLPAGGTQITFQYSWAKAPPERAPRGAARACGDAAREHARDASSGRAARRACRGLSATRRLSLPRASTTARPRDLVGIARTPRKLGTARARGRPPRSRRGTRR